MDCNGQCRVTSKIVAEITQKQLDEEGTLLRKERANEAEKRTCILVISHYCDTVTSEVIAIILFVSTVSTLHRYLHEI
jgi:hypothetical protein